MTVPLDEIIARTKQRQADGTAGHYPHHRGGGAPAAPVQSEQTGNDCAHLGKKQEGGCGPQLFACNLLGGTTTRFIKCDKASHHCETCKFDTRKQPETLQLSRPTITIKNPEYGVAIGSYKWPELIDLQCRLIRDTCGAVPILVCSDNPADAAAMAAITKKHPDVTLSVNPVRIGHTGGDVAVFWKAVKWGAARGLKVVAKLSQRFLVTVPNWLQGGAQDLIKSGLPIATRKCTGRSKFDLRTEAALLDVKQWGRPEVLRLIRPREYWKDKPAGLSAESVIFRALQDALGGYFWPWHLFGEERFQKYPGVIWHCSDFVE